MPDGEDLSLKVADLHEEIADLHRRFEAEETRADAKEAELEAATEKYTDLLASCKERMARVIDAAYSEGLKDTIDAIADLENFHNKDLRNY